MNWTDSQNFESKFAFNLLTENRLMCKKNKRKEQIW